MKNISLYLRKELNYDYFLDKFLSAAEPIDYKKLKGEDRFAVDILINLHLADKDDNGIIKMNQPHIVLWDKFYRRSINWYIYYQSDCIRKKYEERGINYDQIDEI